MKNGTETPLFLLVLVVVAVIGMSMWASTGVDRAAVQVNATVASAQLPEASSIISQLSGWLVGGLIGIAITTIATGLGLWIKSQMPRWFGRDKRRWQAGPNAGWQERAPRQVSSDEMLRMMMMQQMMGQQQTRGRRMQQPQPDVDIDDDLRF